MSYTTNEGHTLQIKVTGLKNSKGKLMVGIYDRQDGFRDTDKTFRNLVLNATAGEMMVYADKLPPGQYAIAVFHDENENGKLDKNFLGIPTEKYGFSNNARGKFGPPEFKDCAISISNGSAITIRLD